MTTKREQDLVDIMFQIGHSIHNNKWFGGKSNEEVMKWIGGQLNACGFYNIPMGASWGSLCSRELYEKYKDDA